MGRFFEIKTRLIRAYEATCRHPPRRADIPKTLIGAGAVRRGRRSASQARSAALNHFGSLIRIGAGLSIGVGLALIGRGVFENWREVNADAHLLVFIGLFFCLAAELGCAVAQLG